MNLQLEIGDWLTGDWRLKIWDWSLESDNYRDLGLQIRHWRLNERHYGALTGLNKAEMAEIHGKEQVNLWFNWVMDRLTSRNSGFGSKLNMVFLHFLPYLMPLYIKECWRNFETLKNQSLVQLVTPFFWF